MPTYVYRFVETGETIEVQQAFTDATLTEFAHPDSGEVLPVKKVFTPVGVTFKGSGFFKTDNRDKPSKSESSSSKDSAKTSSKTDGSTSKDSGSSSSTDSSSSASTPSSSGAKTDSSASSTKPASVPKSTTT
jgi:predicted nucleic acid-binding Zn ribbon protein